jgi:hypothetical protein
MSSPERKVEQMMRRRHVLAAIAGIAAAIKAGSVKAESRKMTVYKSPTCGCCADWVKHVEAAGFEVDVQHVEDLDTVKRVAGVPDGLQACHTAVLENHRIIEGHVPVHAIENLLDAMPGTYGLSAPGMPMGSPGMEGPDPEIYDIIAFGQGEPMIVGRYKGKDPVTE